MLGIKVLDYKVFLLLFLTGTLFAEYPVTSIGVIDLNLILSESKAAKDAAKQIEEIAIQIEQDIASSDQEMINDK